jgi:hypothetical protein
MWRRLADELGAGATKEAIDALDAEAETPGQAVYAAIDGPVVLGVALLRLPEGTVEVLGTLPGREDVRRALVERAFHDAAAAGVADLNTIEA